jgi:PhnB protein
MAVRNPPEGYTSITPYLIVADAAGAIDFYVRAFGAQEIMRLPMEDRIAHAEIRIGNAIMMLSDEFASMGMLGPKARGGPTASLMLYVDDVDTVFAQAIAAGAIEERAVTDEFYGDRTGTLVDPFGCRWMIATHVEDVAPDEIERRLAAMGS